jgi:hypothetical protein
MRRTLVFGSLLTLCFWTVSSLALPLQTDNKPAKKKDKDDDKDKKTESVKRAQTTAYQTVSGTVAELDDKTFTLKATVGKREVKVEGIILAEDVKVRMPAEVEFDRKGKPKPPKRDPNDPDSKYGGVKGSKDDLRDGQHVQVKLGKYRKKLVATIIVVLPEKAK